MNSKIEKLKKKDIEEASKIYNRGLRMEIPKGKNSLEYAKKILSNVYCFVYKENNKVKGLVAFEINKKNKIIMKFICSMKLRKGLGKKLMKKMAKFAKYKKIKVIYSNVSSKNKRVIAFYEYLGFKRYGNKKASRDFILYLVKAKPTDILNTLK